MSRVKAPFMCLIALLAAVVLAACGVTADTTAATVAGKTVSVETVNALARDKVFGVPSESGASESVLPGDQARAALLLAVQATAWASELQRFGVPLSAQAKAAANEQIDAQLGQQGAPSEISEVARQILVQFIAAQGLLTERFKSITDASSNDLRLLYDGLPVAREFTCMTVAEVDPKLQDTVLGKLSAGAQLEGLPELFPEVSIVATAEECIPTALLSGAIQQVVQQASIGVVAEPLELTDSQGSPIIYLIRVDERKVVPFEEAAPGLLRLISQGPETWVQLVVASAQINSRYGSSVGTGPTGEPAILPPPAPELPSGALLDAVVSPATNAP
ncbi:MAG: hypothetical protein WD029_02160 [Microthrixaceae bacterium]